MADQEQTNAEATESICKDSSEVLQQGEDQVESDEVTQLVEGVKNIELCASKELVEKLTEEATLKNTDLFTPKLQFGKVVKVYDGDTVHIVCPILNALDASDPSKFLTARFKVRLNNLDTPEVRTKNYVEKKYAVMARDLLSEKVLNRVVELRNVDYDKYGRILADVFHEETNLSDWIVDQGLGVHYDGGTKKDIDWEELRSSVISACE